jgi:hypothetical protein
MNFHTPVFDLLLAHGGQSKIREYGSAEFNDYRLWDYKQGG